MKKPEEVRCLGPGPEHTFRPKHGERICCVCRDLVNKRQHYRHVSVMEGKRILDGGRH